MSLLWLELMEVEEDADKLSYLESSEWLRLLPTEAVSASFVCLWCCCTSCLLISLTFLMGGDMAMPESAVRGEGDVTWPSCSFCLGEGANRGAGTGGGARSLDSDE